MSSSFSVSRLLKSTPLHFLRNLLLVWLAIFTVTRFVLFFASMSDWIGHAGIDAAGAVFIRGLIFDLGFLAYTAIPVGLILLLIPNRAWDSRYTLTVLNAVMALSIFLMLFFAASEWFFWDEFGARFNFIAVDYLVYSEEVISNIRESYPLAPILSALALLALGLTWLLQPELKNSLQAKKLTSTREKLSTLAALLLPAVISFSFLNQDGQESGGNTYLRELSGNGPYQFFSAFRNNTLRYDQFYANLENRITADILHRELYEPNAHFLSDNPMDIHRQITNAGTPIKYNVVLVTIESLSAKYLGSFGDKRGLTPNLDALRKESLFFNNFYATGTRTDRGLEAVTLSMPPTPGRSIVKRIGHESGYGSLGQQLTAQGYDSVFVYGGRGYFDNMNAFFSGNGYRIVDQSSVPESEIHFKNAWGMGDGDLYSQAIKVADADYAQQKPFFMHVMTTSNHRPYTYPDGAIDIPSGKGRDGAVKYTDYTIAQFLKEAKQKPWFGNTIFVFLADHCAGSAGKEDLPVENYHIPLWIYAPGILEARESAQLASQIDVAPTLLGLLNVSYISSFYGRNLLLKNDEPDRVLIGNYQHLGLFDGKDLAILSPGKAIRKHLDARGESTETVAVHNDPLIMRAISYYQSASIAYKEHWLGWQAPSEQQLIAPVDNALHKNTPVAHQAQDKVHVL